MAQDDMKQRILEGAHELLTRGGYRSFTLELLSDTIGIARKTIYNHFPSRDALVEAVLIYDAEAWIAELTELIDSPDRGFVEKTAILLQQSMTKLGERAGLLSEAPMLRRQLLRAENQRTFREVASMPVARLLRQGIDDGFVSTAFDPDRLAELLLNVVLGPDKPGTLDPALLPDVLHALSVGVLTEKGRAELPIAKKDGVQ